MQKSLEYEGDGDINCKMRTWNGPQSIGKKSGGTGNQRKNRDHADHSSVKIE